MKELLFSQGQVTDSEERGTCRIIKGYSALFSNISKPFESKILFHSIVKKVVWKKGEVVIHILRNQQSKPKIIRAKKLLITIPVGVLKQKSTTLGAIEFSPPLAQKNKTLKYLEMGPVVKLAFEFKADFWSKKFSESIAMFH